MSHMMKVKSEQWTYRAACKQSGECPELMDRESEGPAECVDGLFVYQDNGIPFILEM